MLALLDTLLLCPFVK